MFVFFRSSSGDVSVFCWLGTTSLYWWLRRNNSVPGRGHLTCCVFTPCLPPPLLIIFRICQDNHLCSVLTPLMALWELSPPPHWPRVETNRGIFLLGSGTTSRLTSRASRTAHSAEFLSLLSPLSLSLGLFCCNLVFPDLLTPEALDPFSFYRHIPVDLLPLHEFP